MNKTRHILGALSLAALAAAPLSAATLILNPTDDGYIRASQNTTQTANTSNLIFLVGDTTTANDYLRGVLSFNLNNAALVGATINSVTLTLVVQSVDGGASPTSANASVTLSVHELSTAFSESTVSWTTPWTTAGGDFGASLATTSANAATVTVGSTINFTGGTGSDLAGSVLDSVGGSLYLLVKLASEDTSARNIFRIGSTEGSSLYYPVLTIDYTAAAIPEPSTFALLGGVAAIGLVAVRRRR